MVRNKGGDSARSGDFAAAGEHLPALRVRPLGQTRVAQEHRGHTGDVIVVRYADDSAPRAQRAEEQGPMLECVTA